MRLRRTRPPSITLGCVIDGMCRGIGADQPGNACSSCNPAVSTSQWTPKILGTPCDDGQFCTQIDTCNGAGACGGTTRTCSDGLACTADSCNENMDSCVNAVGDGCVINGTCRAAGATNPLNPCQVCNPNVSTTAWTNAVGAVYDDGFFCTENDTCNALATCTGTAKSCDDGLSCTIEVCNELTEACDITINTGCVIDGQCRGLMSDNPENACQQCNPVTNARAWTNRLLGTPCTDGQYCTQVDACNGSGSCVGTPRICTDGLACTTDGCNEAGDQCVYSLGGGCIINGVRLTGCTSQSNASRSHRRAPCGSDVVRGVRSRHAPQEVQRWIDTCISTEQGHPKCRCLPEKTS